MRYNNFWAYRRILFSRRFLSSLWRSRKNILADDSGLGLRSGPYLAELDVTYRCVCRCRMCRRWQDDRQGEMTPDEYAGLSREFERLGVHLVSIAGGEPFLRRDIFPIIESFSTRGMAVNVSSSGVLLEENAEQIVRSRVACLTVSIDGATAKTHEKIREAPGSYEKIERGVLAFLTFPAKRRPVLRVRMTMCRENIGEVRKFYEKWRLLADDVLLQPVHRCPSAFYEGADPHLFHLDPEVLSRELAGTPFLGRGGYVPEFLQSLRRGQPFPANRCYAGVLMVRLDPWGNVYPCLEQHVRVGSVREKGFGRMWASPEFDQVRRNLAANGKCGCWYNNTALISHYASVLGKTNSRLFSIRA